MKEVIVSPNDVRAISEDLTTLNGNITQLTNKSIQKFSGENTTTNEGIIAAARVTDNDHILAAYCTEGYICLPFKNPSGHWRIKCLNYQTMEKVAQNIQIHYTILYVVME